VGNVTRSRTLWVILAVATILAAPTGAALATWTSTTSDTTAFTSGLPLLTPTSVTAGYAGCFGSGVTTVQVSFTVPGGSGGDSVAAFYATSSGGPYTSMGVVALPASNGYWHSPISSGHLYIEVATTFSSESSYSAMSAPQVIGPVSC
jgi:hypothetical protein